MGGGAQVAADVCKPAADPARGQGTAGRGPGFPGAAQAGGVRPGQQQLGEGGHDQADPPVGLLGGADPGSGQAEGGLGELKGVFFVEAGQVGAPQLVERERGRPGVPEPHGLVRGAAIGQVLDGDAQHGAAQDGQLAVPAGEVAAVAVDEGMHFSPGVDADGAVPRGVWQDEGFIGFGVGLAGIVAAGDCHAVLAGAAFLAGPGDGVGVEHAAGGQPDQQVHGLPGQRGGQRGGAVPGVHDDQRRGAPAGAGCVQAAQQVRDLPGRLPGAGGGGGALGIDQGGPRGAQVPERGGELVFPAGDGLAGAVAAAGVMMDVAASW